MIFLIFVHFEATILNGMASYPKNGLESAIF